MPSSTDDALMNAYFAPQAPNAAVDATDIQLNAGPGGVGLGVPRSQEVGAGTPAFFNTGVNADNRSPASVNDDALLNSYFNPSKSAIPVEQKPDVYKDETGRLHVTIRPQYDSDVTLPDIPPPHPFGWGDTWPVQLVKTIASGLTLPGDVYKGNVQIPSLQGIPGSTTPNAYETTLQPNAIAQFLGVNPNNRWSVPSAESPFARTNSLAGTIATGGFPSSVGNSVSSLLADTAIPSTRAANALISAVGPENLPAVLQRLERNPDLSLMDVAPGVQTRAMGIAQNEGAGQDTLFKSFENRTKGAAGGDYAPYEALGPQSNVIKDRDAIVQQAKDVGDKLINPAIENAQPVPIKPVLKSIDKAIGSPEAIAGETPRIPLDPTQLRLLKLRNHITNGEAAPLNERVGLAIKPVNDALNGGTLGPQRSADFTEARRLLNSARRGMTSEDDLIKGLDKLSKNQKIVGPIDNALSMIKKGPIEYRGADFMHGIQSRLREEAEALRSSSSGSERLMSKDLFDARSNIIDNIDKASGGTYKPALSDYRDAMQVRDAFDKGIGIDRMRASEEGIEDSPEALREWKKNASPEELLAAQKGALWNAQRKVGMMRNAGVTGGDMPPPLSPFTRQKYETLFGKDAADNLVQNLQDKRDISNTNSLLFRQSKTARTQEGVSLMKPREVGPLNAGTGIGVPALLEAAGYFGHPELSALGGAIFAGSMLRKGVQYGMQKSDLARNALFAKAASATGAEREPIMSLLRSHAQNIGQSNKFTNALSQMQSGSALQK